MNCLSLFILFYTDGVTEAKNEKSKLFGEKRLLEIASSECTIGNILEAVATLSGSAAQSDDITISLLRIGPAV